MTGQPTLGVTAYSFTTLFHAGQASFEQLVERAGELGLGPGLEVVGFQSIRGFPRLDDAWVTSFRSLLDRHALEPSCLGANADIAIRSDRLLTEDEQVEYLGAQLEAARRLGFPVIRVQNGATPTVIARLAPLAERLGVRMGMEIHSPATVHSDWVQRLRETYADLDTPYVGWIPDFGASTRGLSPSLIAAFRAKGVSDDMLERLRVRWDAIGEGPVDARVEMPAVVELAREHGAAEHAMALAVFSVGIHGHQPASDWAEILPDVVHVHGKFFDIDGDGREPSIPYEDLLTLLVDGGYEGYISSEWEGWHWDPSPDPFDMVQRHQALCRRILQRTTVVEG